MRRYRNIHYPGLVILAADLIEGLLGKTVELDPNWPQKKLGVWDLWNKEAFVMENTVGTDQG